MTNSVLSKLYLKEVSIEGFRSLIKTHSKFNNGLNILIGKNGVGKSNLLYVLNEALRFFGLSDNTPLKKMLLVMESNDSLKRFETSYVRKSIDSDSDAEEKYLYFNQKYYFERNYFLDGVAFIPKMVKKTNPITGESIERASSRYKMYNFILKDENVRFPNAFLLEYNIPNEIGFIDFSGKIIIDCNVRSVHYPSSFNFLNKFLFNIESIIESLFSDYWDEESNSVNENLNILSKAIDLEFIEKHFVIDEDLIESLRKYTPIESIRFNQNVNLYQDDQNYIIDNLKIDFLLNGNWIPWNNLSDGTKRLFYIVSEIQGLNNDIILLEEPELGIHPHQFYQLMQFLVDKSQNNQIIMSTHSPLALDHINVDELSRIQLVSYSKETGTQCRNLSKEEELKALDYIQEVGYLSDYWVHSDLDL